MPAVLCHRIRFKSNVIHKETVKLMKASVCKGIFAGIESVSKESLAGQNKAEINSVGQYVLQARTLIDCRINVIGAIMFGFDEDTKESLISDTLEFQTS